MRGFKSGFTASSVVEAYFEIAADEKVATPTISPNSGTSVEPVAVSLATATAGAEIYYTTDGTSPTLRSTLYETPFVLRNSATVRAKAFKAGLMEIEAAAANFMIGVAVQPVEIILDDNDVYKFNAGVDGYIKMTDETTEKDSFVIADAVKLVYFSTRGRRGRRVGKSRRKIGRSKVKARRGGKKRPAGPMRRVNKASGNF